MFNEKGEPVEWEAGRAAQLIDGLRPELMNKLSALIGADDPSLNAPADDENPDGELLGEGSAASSMPL